MNDNNEKQTLLNNSSSSSSSSSSSTSRQLLLKYSPQSIQYPQVMQQLDSNNHIINNNNDPIEDNSNIIQQYLYTYLQKQQQRQQQQQQQQQNLTTKLKLNKKKKLNKLKFILIPSNQIYWKYNSIRYHGGRKWKQQWDNEIQRIETIVSKQQQSKQQQQQVQGEVEEENNDMNLNNDYDDDNNDDNIEIIQMDEDRVDHADTENLQKAKVTATSFRGVKTTKLLSSSSLSDSVEIGTNNNTTSETTISSVVINDTALFDYFYSTRNNNSDMFIIKWNASGILEGTSYIRHDDWFQKKEMEHIHHIHHQYIKPNEDRVAIVFNTDVMHEIDWTYKPPIPVLVYTLPNSVTKEGTTDSNFYLIPPPYDRGYNQWCIWKAEHENALLPFEKRKNILIWRGALHSSVDPNRAILVAMSKNQSLGLSSVPGTKVGSKKKKKRKQKRQRIWLDAALTDDSYLSIEEMVQYRYQIDIGGQSGTSWGGIRWKMCTGSLVFKVDTWSRDWWHNQIHPYQHYIPVYANLSNLYDQYIWVEQNPDIAYRIAQAGSMFCNENVKLATVVHYWRSVIESLPTFPSNGTIVQQANEIISKRRPAV